MPGMKEQIEQLTAADIENTRQSVGMFVDDRDGQYYAAMEKVYAAAETLAVHTPADLAALAERAGVKAYATSSGLPEEQVQTYYTAVKSHRPGSKAWAEAIAPIGPLNYSESTKASDLALREAVNAAGSRLIQERRTVLLTAQKRIKSELETLACMKIPGGKA